MATRHTVYWPCAILAFVEESHRGLVGATGNRVCLQGHRGFESHLLRHDVIGRFRLAPGVHALLTSPYQRRASAGGIAGRSLHC
jgi:hypothetical protein